MGEIADMMLDGTMCAGCGVFLHEGSDGPGYPGYCASCAPDYAERRPKNNVVCPECGKKLRDNFGLKQHTEAKHLRKE